MHCFAKYFNMMRFCVDSKCFSGRYAKRTAKIGPVLTIRWPLEFSVKNKVVLTYCKIFTGAMHLKSV